MAEKKPKLTRAEVVDKREDLEHQIDQLESELYNLQRDCPHPKMKPDKSGYCDDCGGFVLREPKES